MKKYISQAKILLSKYYAFLIFLVAFTGMFGSLYFSEIINLAPCSLCYIQRGLMYPIVFLALIVTTLEFKRFKPWMFLVFAIPGVLVAIYNIGVQLTGSESALCVFTEKSCAIIDLIHIGPFSFSIPFLSFVGFSSIILIVLIKMWIDSKNSKKSEVNVIE